MFTDSDIANTFSCEENKVDYVSTFGIAPHFLSLMITKAKKESCYELLFDESLNCEMKKCQLDMHMKFWNDNQVNTRYLTFFFRCYDSAEQMNEKVETVCSDISFQNLIQLTMNGLN